MSSTSEDAPRSRHPVSGASGYSKDLVERSRQLIAKGSKSFAGAAAFFDPQTRAGVYLLYAWCRHCDDAIDGQELGFRLSGKADSLDDKRRELAQLEQETRRCFEGKAQLPPFIGLGEVMARCGIERRYPLDLLEGLRMDVDGRTYQRLDELLEYCYGVAGTVGVMMATIMGVRSQAHLRCACDLGIAFQLTNIARDVVSDHQAGRVYLPTNWLREHQLSPATLADLDRRQQLASVVARLLDIADAYYRSAADGLPALSLRSAWAVATASSVYRAIGHNVRRKGAAAWNDRISVGRLRKLQGASAGLVAAIAASTVGRFGSPPDRGHLWTPSAFASALGKDQLRLDDMVASPTPLSYPSARQS